MARQGLPRVVGAAGDDAVAKQVCAVAPVENGATDSVTPAATDAATNAGTDAAPVVTAAPARAGGPRGLPRAGAAATASNAATAADGGPEAAATSAAQAAPGRRQGMPRPPASASAQPAASAASSPVAASAATEVSSPAAAVPVQPKDTITVPATPTAQAGGVASGRRRLVHGGLVAAALLVLMAGVVLVARWLVTLGPVQSFLTQYPGESELPHGAPVGIPTWLGWQHFFNVFFMVLIIRSGWQVRTQRRPPATWTSRWGANPKKISITLWLHQSLDILWLVNGVIFVVLLAVTGQWMRVVPTSWGVIPNALSAALQYVSLDWPTENGWVNYNSLQVLAYFVTIFIAAPLAAASGFRMSAMWPAKAKRLSTAYPIELARAIHFPVMLYFVGFIIVHVALVLSTGALRNLNHIHGGQDAVNWVGFWIFFASFLVIVGGWFAARPLVLAPIASLFGKVGR